MPAGRFTSKEARVQVGVFELRGERNYFISRRLELVGSLTALEVDFARCVLKERFFFWLEDAS